MDKGFTECRLISDQIFKISPSDEAIVDFIEDIQPENKKATIASGGQFYKSKF